MAMLRWLVLVAAACFALSTELLKTAPLEIWTVQLTVSHNTTFGQAAPVVGANLVAVLVIEQESQNTSLCVVNATTGSLVWRVYTPFVQDFSGWVAVGQTDAGALMIATGTDRSVLAFDALLGTKLWEYDFAPNQVPAHVSVFEGLVVFALENGDQSAPLTALNASSGQLVFTTEDLAFTIIWPTDAGVMVYCSWDKTYPNGTGLGVVARRANGDIAWSHYNLTSTNGTQTLNNNPNLVVDKHNVFMYSRPKDDLRFITLFDAETGDQQWNLSTAFNPDDYDTFAWGNRFFRLVALHSTAQSTTFMIQAIDTGRNILWTQQFDTPDPNYNILVGAGAAMAVANGPSADEIIAFDVNTGEKLWRLGVTNPYDGGTDDATGVLYFGDGVGQLHAVQVSATRDVY